MNWSRSGRRRIGSHVSASQLAQMGMCETLVVFEHRYGKRPRPSQRLALKRGRRAHQRFLRQAGPNTPPALGSLSRSIARVVAESLRSCMLWCRVAWRYLRGTWRDG